ncbi:MAG: carboxypeptidase-like regulatory domain-containing protein, partial [Planctomycetota bacterium]
GGSVQVTVRADDGKPLARATVLFVTADGQEHNFSQVPETDADGRFRAVGLAPGSYTVRVQCAGHEPASLRLDFTPGEETLLPITLRPRAAR